MDLKSLDLNMNPILIIGLSRDGNSKIDAHVRRNLCYLICLRHSIKSKAVTNRFDQFLFMQITNYMEHAVLKRSIKKLDPDSTLKKKADKI